MRSFTPRKDAAMARDRKGSIVERDGRVYARLQFIGIDGRKRDLWRKANNRTHARQVIKQLLRELDEHGEKPIDASRMTFADLCDYYSQRYCKPAEYVDGRKVDGLRDWKHVRAFLRIFKHHFGKRRLRAITYADIKAFRLTRLKTPTQYNHQRTITTVNRELSCLRRMLNVAVRETWISKNPFTCGDSLISFTSERQRERILNNEEEKHLLYACEHPHRKHLRPILICALDTGMRQGEIFKLKWTDICFETHLITIQAFNTKTMRERCVGMTARLKEELEQLYQLQSPSPDALVFGVTNNVRKSFLRARRDAGLMDVRFHDLRHTHATRLDDLGFSLARIGGQLGHTILQTTLRYVNRDKAAIQQVARALDGFNAAVVDDIQTIHSPVETLH
jgi:integrase